MYFIVAIISCIESFAVTIFFVKACITYLEIEIRFTQSLHQCPFVWNPIFMLAIVRKGVFGKITRTDDLDLWKAYELRPGFLFLQALELSA